MKTQSRQLASIISLFFLGTSLLPLSIYAQSSGESCIDCHDDMVNRTVMHAAAQDACDNCHLPNGNEHPESGLKSFTLNEEMPGLCYICHETPDKQFIHAPSEFGECSMCHDPHGSPNQGLLINTPQSKLCAECHDVSMTERPIKHAPVEEGNCASCHDPHQSDVSGFLITNKPDLCLSCHESTKEATTYSNIHPPFDDDCANCHDPHSSEADRLLVEKSPDLCYMCHDNVQLAVDSAAFPHPVVEDGCANCHSAHASNESSLLLANEKELCFMCHESFSKQNIHAAVEMGSCADCHQTHGSKNPSLLTQASQSAVCAECHDMSMTEKASKHAPVEMGACSDCHDPHESDFTAFLKNDKKALCGSCHETVRLETTMSNLHPPFEDDCSNCHETHSADETNLLSIKSPDLCYMCHDNIQTALEGDAITHSVVMEGKGCANCHSAHASNRTGLLNAGQKDVCMSCHNRTITVKEALSAEELGLLAENTDESNNQEASEEVAEPFKEREITNIGRQLKDGNHIHTVIELDGCTACHNPHSSGQNSLLTGAFPEGMYAVANADNFELCFTCHDAELMLAENTTSATNFRDGDRNMHFLHINGNKGRSCNLCHNVHGAPNEHLIEDHVMFGNWKMPIGFLATITGGSCATGCHAEKSYTRLNSIIQNETDSSEIED